MFDITVQGVLRNLSIVFFIAAALMVFGVIAGLFMANHETATLAVLGVGITSILGLLISGTLLQAAAKALDLLTETRDIAASEYRINKEYFKRATGEEFQAHPEAPQPEILSIRERNKDKNPMGL